LTEGGGDEKVSASLKRRAARAGGWALAKRIIKPLPVVGTAVALGLAGYEIRRKGAVRGVVHVGLDALPVVGTAKAVLELFTGDLIADKDDPRQPRRRGGP